MTKLLYAQKTKKFDEICALVARERGYGELSTLSDEDRNQVDDEAQYYVREWEEKRSSSELASTFVRSRLYAVS